MSEKQLMEAALMLRDRMNLESLLRTMPAETGLTWQHKDGRQVRDMPPGGLEAIRDVIGKRIAAINQDLVAMGVSQAGEPLAA